MASQCAKGPSISRTKTRAPNRESISPIKTTKEEPRGEGNPSLLANMLN